MKKPTVSFTQSCLTTFYVVCLLVSNVITSKQIQLPFGITMTGAVTIFPITYILSDVFSEVYGYRWSRMTCTMSFLANLFMSLIFMLVIAIPSPSWWGNQDAFTTVLGNSPRILVASLSGFYLGDWMNDFVFRKMKEKDKEKRFGLRAITSSLFGEFVDSLVFVPVAFLGQMPIKTLGTMILIQPILKVVYEIIVLPLTSRVCLTLKKNGECEHLE